MPAICLICSVPVYSAALFTPSLYVGWPLFVVAQALAYAYLGPMVAAVQQLVPAQMRATTSACFQLINNLIGVGLGTVLFGFMSDSLGAIFGADALRWSILAGLVFYLISALLCTLAARRLRTDWYDGEA